MWRHSNAGTFNAVEAHQRIVDLYKYVADGSFSKEHFAEAAKVILADCWRAVPLQKKGVFDLIGFHLVSGRFVAVELKLGTDRLSDDQRNFLEVARDSGCETWVIKDFDAFSASFRQRQMV
jgi:hypothetical protein